MGGKFARWNVIIDGPQVIKLQNQHTKKFLRITQGGAVNVLGENGPLTRLRYKIWQSPNGVKLESVRFPGKWVAVMPNGTVQLGMGGPHCKLLFYRSNGGGQQVQQPQAYVQSQVIVQQPNLQQQMQQQMAAQQAVIAQQQQQMMAQQQAQVQQQMAQMKLEHEQQMAAQKQAMEAEKLRMHQQQMAMQQPQQQANSGYNGGNMYVQQ